MQKKLCDIVGKDNVLLNEMMNKHTTFRVGGAADFFVTPHLYEQVQQIIALCRSEQVPYYIIGNGSNLIVKDNGIRGVVIQLFRNFASYSIEGTHVTAQAGIMLSKLSKPILEAGLTGFEFASGIPGTLGGAVTMNAGAYDGEMKDIVTKVKVLDSDGNVITLTTDEFELGYRRSIIASRGYIVLEVEMELKPGNYHEIKTYMAELAKRRIEKQPLEFPSAGSTFKRPEGFFAGKLIMDSGLAGYSVGGAKVSEKHCGFVINAGGATASDILQLISEVQEKVYNKFGVQLETEVKVLGE